MRRLPSRRRLLPDPEPTEVGGWGLTVIFLILSGFLWLLWNVAGLWIFAMLAGFVVMGVVGSFRSKRRLRRLAVAREDKSICSFARGFDCRSIDTVIIRAVHLAVLELIEPTVPSFPLRADDRFEEDLQLCGDDIHELAEVAAHRAGRSLESFQSNPLFGKKVETVCDLVQFLAWQPAVARP